MKQRINRYIPLALAAIREQISGGTADVDERYDGYAASLGPAIITSGLKTAMAFYTDLHRGGSGPRRYEILKAITTLLVQDGENIQNPLVKNALLEHVLLLQDVRPIQEKIMDAVIALKLAFRNFNQIKTNEA